MTDEAMTDETMTAKAAKPETRAFEAEVGRLLDIVANALYSEREIFLRELISNASDACDRLRYAAITAPELLADDPELKVTLAIDKKARRLTVADNGIGMDRVALIDDLGTIARSGTTEFLSALSGDAKKDMALIGQFGVGFYSAFMVADEIEVVSRKAGEEATWAWRSDGKGAFTVGPAEEARSRGTAVTLHLRKDADEFLDPERLRRIVKTYSDHVGLPILLETEGGSETINAASALWTRPKKEITPEQYTEFYHHVSHGFDDPLLVMHNRIEGKIEYTSLLYVPSARPFDLFHPDRVSHLKLYVKRVFITDRCDELVPGYMRFLRGIVDSEDLALNISREMLQSNPVIARIRAGLIKRVLGELERLAKKKPEDYAKFWDNFGAVLKEGIYEDLDYRDRLLALTRFRTTASDDAAISLDKYVERMKDGQEAIYYLSADTLEAARRSPHLEAFKAKGVEVLLVVDPVDEFWMPAVGAYRDKPFKSVTQGGIDLDAIAGDAETAEKIPEDGPDEGRVSALVAALRLALEDTVKDVRVSARLTDSPVCLIADEGDLDMRIERLLAQHRQVKETAKRVLEINPRHPLIAALAERVGRDGAAETITDAAHLLLDQARILEGEPPTDAAAFARRLSAFMAKGLAI